MKRILFAFLVFALVRPGTDLSGADSPTAARSSAPALPPQVVQKTREQLVSFLGVPELKGIPLLDPAIDWNLQVNWPNHFLYQGRSYELDITELTEDGPKPVLARGSVRPGMTVLFAYEPNRGGRGPAVTNAILPRASWSPRGRVPGKLLIWGSTSFGGIRREVFNYEYYPDGKLYQFYWQPRATEAGHWEVFEPSGRRIGVRSPAGCEWNSAKVAPEQFQFLSTNLRRSSGFSAQPAARPVPAPAVRPLRR